jgi:hypothetical protein
VFLTLKQVFDVVSNAPKSTVVVAFNPLETWKIEAGVVVPTPTPVSSILMRSIPPVETPNVFEALGKNIPVSVLLLYVYDGAEADPISEYIGRRMVIFVVESDALAVPPVVKFIWSASGKYIPVFVSPLVENVGSVLEPIPPINPPVVLVATM